MIQISINRRVIKCILSKTKQWTTISCNPWKGANPYVIIQNDPNTEKKKKKHDPIFAENTMYMNVYMQRATSGRIHAVQKNHCCDLYKVFLCMFY